MPQEDVDALVAAATAKLQANQDVIGRSPYGRLTWRKTKNGGFEIELEAKL